MNLRTVLLIVFAALHAHANPLPLQQGDRLLLLGATFIERDGNYGHLETHLMLQHPEKDLVVRNIGWSGDNVFGESRAYFGPRSDGYKHVINTVQQQKPSVVLVNYGANEAYQGSHGLNAFVEGYKQLLTDLQSVTSRLVLVGLPACETLGAPLPDMAEHNERVKMYEEAIGRLAKERGLTFLPLFDVVKSAGTGLTDNGIHFTEQGYQKIAAAWLGKPSVSDVYYTALRKEIVAKNELFFYSFRPQNETYLRGFRKHEQGNNAVEIGQFVPLIEAKDQSIHAMLKGGAK